MTDNNREGTLQASMRSFPTHLLSERQEFEERGIFVYRPINDWWEFLESYRDPVVAQERVHQLADDGKTVCLVKRLVTASPWATVSIVNRLGASS